MDTGIRRYDGVRYQCIYLLLGLCFSLHKKHSQYFVLKRTAISGSFFHLLFIFDFFYYVQSVTFPRHTGMLLAGIHYLTKW